MKWFIILFFAFYLSGTVYLLFNIHSVVDDILIILEETHSVASYYEGLPLTE